MCNTVMWGYDDEHITPGAGLMAANTGGRGGKVRIAPRSQLIPAE